jgi:hypothetical protein
MAPEAGNEGKRGAHHLLFVETVSIPGLSGLAVLQQEQGSHRLNSVLSSLEEAAIDTTP